MSEESTTQTSEDPAPNAEAAKYRTRLRDAEKALQDVTAQRDTLARSMIEGHLPAHVTPKLFWQLHEGLDGLMGDDGAVDVAAVTAAAQTIAKDYGLNLKNTAPIVPNVGNVPERPSQTMWQEVVTGHEELNEA